MLFGWLIGRIWIYMMIDAVSNPGIEKSAPILVTGAHRTGTTWVGKMLSANGQVGYISEPLNVLHRPGVMNAPISCWYTYICGENEADFLPGLRQTLKFHYGLWAEIRSLRSLHDLGRMGRDWSSFLRAKTLKQRPLVKDPFAFFSAPWFAARLGCQVVITIRHPAAFVSSLKRLRWPFDLRDLLAQPLLMRDLLAPFQAEIEDFCSDPTDEIGQNSLLWRIIYSLAKDFQNQYPHFQMVRHEDLSRHPVAGFRTLYDELGLEYNDRANRSILDSTSAENPRELSSNSIHSFRLNSQASLDNWKHRLSDAEILRISRITAESAASYYPELEWV